MDSELVFLEFMAMHVNYCQTSEHHEFDAALLQLMQGWKSRTLQTGNNVKKLPELCLVTEE